MEPRGGNCRQCGEPLMDGALAGNCPRCLAILLLDPTKAAEAGDDPEILRRLGDFELLDEIARGGMGIVYRARQTSLNRFVAVKLLRDSALAGVEEVKRFQVEATAVAKLNHPNIVAIHEVGEQEGQHYFAMELVEGTNLAQRTREGPLPAQAAAGLVATIADAVQHAHEHGVLHRDLKPSNVLLDAEERPFVTDFGLARTLETDSTLTVTGHVLGTPAFMPPEQASGGNTLGPAADIYSLGALLYHLLTGRPPFVGGTATETLRHVIEQEPVSPRLLNPEAPRDLSSVCLKCLSKDPAGRYASAADMSADLRRFLRGEPTRAHPAGPVQRLGRWCRRRPAVAGPLAALLVVGLLGLGGVLWQWREAVAARDAARAADRERREQLHLSLSQQAHFSRLSGRLGHRTNALAAIAAAAALRPTPALRDDALAALMLPDVGERQWWRDEPSFDHPLCFDFSLDHYLPHVDFPRGETRRLTVRRAADHGVAADLGNISRQPDAARFSPDGRFVAVRFADGELRAWDWRIGREIAAGRYGARQWAMRSFDFSPDSHALFFGSDADGICRLDLATGGVVPVHEFPAAAVVRVSRSGRHLLATRGHEVQVWDRDRGDGLIRTNFNGLTAAGVLGAAWHPNEELVALGVEGGLLLWHWPSGVCRAFSDTGAVTPYEPYFNQTGDLLFQQGGVIWDVATQTRIVNFAANIGNDIALSRDEQRMAFQREKIGFGVWKFLPPVGTRAFVQDPFQPGLLPSPDVSPGGRWLASIHGNGWTVWEVGSGRVVARGPPVRQFGARFTADGQALITVGRDGLKRWPVIEAAAAAPGGAIVGAPELILDQLSGPENPTDRPIQGEEGKSALPSPAAPENGMITRGGRFAVLAGSRQARVVDLATTEVSPAIQLHSPDVELALSLDGRWLVTGLHNRPDQDVWDVSSQKHLARISDPPFPACQFHPVTGELAAWNSGFGIVFYEPGSWNVTRRIAWPDGSLIVGLLPGSIAPAGRMILGYTSDGQLSLMNDPGGRQFSRMERPGGIGANSMGFDARGGQVFIGTSNNSLRRFDLTALRGELARLGLDWPEHDPFAFAPRR